MDQRLMIRQLEARMAECPSERQRRMLAQAIAHLEGEVAFDVDMLLAAYPADPRYQIWQDGVDVGPKGRAAVAHFYATQIAAAALLIEYDIERIVLDDHTLVTDGWMTGYFPGSFLQTNGFPEADPAGVYRKAFRNCILWPYNEAGELYGEQFYFSGFVDDSNCERLESEAIPPEYKQMLAAAAVQMTRSEPS